MHNGSLYFFIAKEDQNVTRDHETLIIIIYLHQTGFYNIYKKIRIEKRYLI